MAEQRSTVNSQLKILCRRDREVGGFVRRKPRPLPSVRRPASGTFSARPPADALHRLGKCQIGDKTMYDAPEPFAEAPAGNVDEGLTLVDAWHAAARTATVRARETSTLVPQLGRARPLAERSVRTPDAGATSMALIVTTVGNVLDRTLSHPQYARSGVNGQRIGRASHGDRTGRSLRGPIRSTRGTRH